MNSDHNQNSNEKQFFNKNELNLILADINKIEKEEFKVDLNLIEKAWSKVERKKLFGKQE